MAGKKRNSSFEILTAMQDLNTPAGALQLAQILHLPSASIGRELLELEKAGLLVKVQNKGRILTPQGERFLEEERSRREKMKAANELIEAASMETESGLEDILLVRKLLEGYAAKAEMKERQKKFAAKLASYADVYVMDAFGTAHRKHASTAVIADAFDKDHKMLGFLMEKEVKAVDAVLGNIVTASFTTAKFISSS